MIGHATFSYKEGAMQGDPMSIFLFALGIGVSNKVFESIKENSKFHVSSLNGKIAFYSS